MEVFLIFDSKVFGNFSVNLSKFETYEANMSSTYTTIALAVHFVME